MWITLLNEILDKTLITDFHFDCLQLYLTLNDIFYCTNIILSFININFVVLWSTHSIELVNYQKWKGNSFYWTLFLFSLFFHIHVF